MKTCGTLRLSRPHTVGKTQREQRLWQVKATPDVAIRLKRLFPRARPDRSGELLLVDTPEVARDLTWVMSRWPLETDRNALLHLISRSDEHKRREATVRAILEGRRDHLPLRAPARPARDYQLVARDMALATGHLLLADDVGLGKSMSALLVLLDPETLPALVVCLPHLQRQWVDEVKETLPWLRTHIIRSLEPYDPRTRRELQGHDPDVLIMPWSKLRGWADHLAGQVRTVIFDEAQEVRRTDSQKYMAAAQIADAAALAMGLTATPIYNYGGEIHNVMQVIAPDYLGSQEEFGREWCGGGWSEKARVEDPAALGVYLREQGLMLRRTRKEVGRELPEVIRVPHVVDLDSEKLEALSFDALDLADAILSSSTSREDRFLAAGQLDWRLRLATGVAKAPYVAEFVKLLVETDEQVVLFGWHRDVYAIWQEKLADARPVLYTGTESPAQKHRNKELFLSGEARVLLMSLRAGAGLDDLQDVCKIAVFGELDWSPGMHDQCIGRLSRDLSDGSIPTEPVVAYFLVAEDGSDPSIAEVLNLKRMQSGPMRDPEAYQEGAALQAAVGTEDRVRLLAEDVIRRRRLR